MHSVEFLQKKSKPLLAVDHHSQEVYIADGIWHEHCTKQQIEALQDGEWYRLAFRTDKDNLGFYSEGRVAAPHSVQTGEKRFYFYGDCVPAGTYRLVIGLTPDNDLGPSAIEYLVAEFSIVE